jgi:hypothetical protein
MWTKKEQPRAAVKSNFTNNLHQGTYDYDMPTVLQSLLFHNYGMRTYYTHQHSNYNFEIIDG